MYNDSKPKRFSPSSSSGTEPWQSESGMTLMELMVSSTLSLLLIAMTLSVTLANRAIYGTDVVRTRINQNIRSAFDIIETELRQAGERLPSGVPAIEIAHGASSDTLTLRRNTLDDTLTVCKTVNTSAGNNDIFVTLLAAEDASLPGGATPFANATSTPGVRRMGLTVPVAERPSERTRRRWRDTM